MSKKKMTAVPHAKSQKQSALMERARLAARQPERVHAAPEPEPAEGTDAQVQAEVKNAQVQADAAAVETVSKASAESESPAAAPAEEKAADSEEKAPEPEAKSDAAAAAQAPEGAEKPQGRPAEAGKAAAEAGAQPAAAEKKENTAAPAPLAETHVQTPEPAEKDPAQMKKKKAKNNQEGKSQRRNPPMEGRSIVVTSGKGGVGKTTTTANISMALAKLGKKVVVVDGDTGLRSLDLIMGLENRIVYNLVDVIEGTCDLKKALIRDKRVDGLYLLPTAQTREKDCVTEEQMKQLSSDLRKEFDFVLFDCPAGIEAGFRNASAGADEALVVTTPDVSPVRDADRIIGMLESQGKEQIHLIINRMRPKMMRSGDMLGVDDVLDILSVSLIGVVPEDDAVVKSSNKGEPLTLDPSSPAATAFMNIARRILGEDVPFLDIEHLDRGFFAKLSALFGRR